MSSAIDGLRTPAGSQSFRLTTRRAGQSGNDDFDLRIGCGPLQACLPFAAQQPRCVGSMEGAK